MVYDIKKWQSYCNIIHSLAYSWPSDKGTNLPHVGVSWPMSGYVAPCRGKSAHSMGQVGPSISISRKRFMRTLSNAVFVSVYVQIPPPPTKHLVAMLTASSSLSAYNNIITPFNLELEGGDLICSLHALGMITHKHFVFILTVNTSIQSFSRQFCFNGNFKPLLSHEQLEHHFWSFTKHFVF